MKTNAYGSLLGLAATLVMVACGGGSTGPPSSTGLLPRSFASVAHNTPLASPITRGIGPWGIGPWGVGLMDEAASVGPDKEACSGPKTDCSRIVKKKSLEKSVDSSGTDMCRASSDGYVISAADIGYLLVSTDAKAKAGHTLTCGITGSMASAFSDILWEDTVIVTSKKLPLGTPVKYKAQINVPDSQPSCEYGNTGGANVIVDVGDAGFGYAEGCVGDEYKFISPPTYEKTLSTFVGATISLYGELSVAVNAVAGLPPNKRSFNNANDGEVKLHLIPVTPGTSFKSASGHSYPSS
jgi:hypothetical protein